MNSHPEIEPPDQFELRKKINAQLRALSVQRAFIRNTLDEKQHSTEIFAQLRRPSLLFLILFPILAAGLMFCIFSFDSEHFDLLKALTGILLVWIGLGLPFLAPIFIPLIRRKTESSEILELQISKIDSECEYASSLLEDIEDGY